MEEGGAPSSAPPELFACDVCWTSPVQDTVYRCTRCRLWSCCAACYQLSRRGVGGRAGAAADQGWPAGGPCAHCGARHSAQWRRGSWQAPLLCNACVALGQAGADLFVLEEHDGETHSLQRQAVQPSGAAEYVHSGPLSGVVTNAVQRWRVRRGARARARLSRRRFCEALRSAKQGDANAMELLAQMYDEGYGCCADGAKARFWHAMARDHGARRLDGVYDELP